MTTWYYKKTAKWSGFDTAITAFMGGIGSIGIFIALAMELWAHP